RVKHILKLNDNINAGPARRITDTNDKSNILTQFALTENDPAFARDEMLICGVCLRTNPPNRSLCLYCGANLEAGPVPRDIAKINYQRPEQWEDGFSLVYSAN